MVVASYALNCNIAILFYYLIKISINDYPPVSVPGIVKEYLNIFAPKSNRPST